jgi:hypothetical protein
VNAPEIDLSLAGGRASFAPGEILEADALWALSVAPKTIEARLFWRTRGKGTEDIGLVQRESVPSPISAGEHRFRFTLPAGPYSFSGKLISLLWAIELVAEPGGKVARCEFVLSPSGREIVLFPPTTFPSAPDGARS